MVRYLSQVYSILFFGAISILTMIIVQTAYSFLKAEISFQVFIVSIIIELIFVFVIVKVYDELGCKWESVKTIPLLRRKKEFQTKIQNNYYYNASVGSKPSFCSNCGILISLPGISPNKTTNPKFCKNCGHFINNETINEISQNRFSSNE